MVAPNASSYQNIGTGAAPNPRPTTIISRSPASSTAFATGAGSGFRALLSINVEALGVRSQSSADYRIEAFDINITKRTARCPGGYESTQCSRLAEAKTQKVSFRFEWSYHCRSCPLRSQCVPSDQSHRTIVVGEYDELLQQRRRDQQTQEFKKSMHQRSAIEGTISELARAHGLRRSRY